MDGPGAFHSVADGGLSKQVDKLPRIPLCAWVRLRTEKGPAARPANSGTMGTAGTMGCL